MILTGVEPTAAKGVAVDLNVLSYDSYEDDASGVSYEYDLLKGNQKVLRKGVQREIVRISGRAYLNVRGGAALGWTDPQSHLDNLKTLRGALVDLNYSSDEGTGTRIGQYQVRSASIRRRNRRGDADQFLSVAWEIELVGADGATAATPAPIDPGEDT